MILITLLFLWLGLCAGSFVNALVYRLHMQSVKPKAKRRKLKAEKEEPDLSIISGRSMCVNCRHELAWYDLIPLFSWLSLGGKCRYCKKPISYQYPVVELVMAVVFAGSYLFWPFELNQNGQWLLLATWLVCSVGLLALAVYDLKWMLLPNKIIYPTLAVAVTGRVLHIALFADNPLKSVLLWIFSVAIASGLFFVLFIVSKGKWIGYGDVRLGLITGTLLADPQLSLAMLFVASLLGALTILPSLKFGDKNLSSKIPYGPFLIAATAILVVFGEPLLDWYKSLVI